jgi:hypothetical protein
MNAHRPSSKKGTTMKTILWTALACALLSAAPTVSFAEEDDAEVTKLAKEHYKLGLEAFKAGKYDVAIKELKKAYLLKRLPALLINIGATYRKMGDLDLAQHFYQKYLDEAPPEARDRGEVQRVLAEIKREKAGGGDEGKREEVAEAPRKEEAPPPIKEKLAAPAKEWSHTVIDAAPPDTPIDVRVSTPVMKGVKVFVYYRAPGENDFRSVLMKRRGAEKVGRIPGEAVTGTSLQYYIEARDSAGTLVKSSGSQTNPNIVMVDASARPQLIASREAGASEEPREVPTPREPEKKAQRNLDDETAPVTGKLDEEQPGQPKRRARGAAAAKLGPLGLAGAVLIGVGGAGLAIGITGLVLAKRDSDALTRDSHMPVDDQGHMVFFNNDPNAPGADLSSGKLGTQEAKLASQGKMWNAIGIAGTVGGAILGVGGAALLLTDKVFLKMASEAKAHHKKKRKRRVIEEEEEVSRNWYLTPSAGPQGFGAAGGFSF